MLKGIKRFFVYMLMLFVVTATLQCAVYASERPNSKIDNDWVYYNVQDVFPWAGFEYDLCKKDGKDYNDYTKDQTTITSSIAFPHFFVADAKRNGIQGLQLSADTTMNTASIFNHAVSSEAKVKGPAVDGTLYNSGDKYDNLSQAAKAKKRFLLSGWVKPVDENNNVSAVKVVLNIKKTGESTASGTVVKSVNMTGAKDWTYVGGVVDFDKMFNGNTAGYVLPAGFPSAVGSFNDAEWEISLGIVLEKADKNKALNAYVDDYEIIEQTKTAYAKGTNLWEDPDCEGVFDNFSNTGGVETDTSAKDTSGKDTGVKYSGNSSFKFYVNTSSAWTPQMLGRYMQLNPLKPYYYSFYVKTSQELQGAKIALIYQQYGLTNSNAALKYAGKSQIQIPLANFSVSNNTEWQHFSGVVLLREYRDYNSNKSKYENKVVSGTNLLRPEDQFINSNVYFTVSKVPTNKKSHYSLYFDNIELRELPLNDDEPSSPVLYNPSSYNISYKQDDTIYGLTEHFQDGVQIYDGQATAGKPMTIKTVLINGTTNQNATIITALYDKDTDNLVDVVFSQPQSIPTKNGLTYEHNVDIPQGFDGYIKTFVFDNFDDIKPLDEVATFNMTAPTDDVVVLTVKKDGTGDFESPYLANQSITDSSEKKNI